MKTTVACCFIALIVLTSCCRTFSISISNLSSGDSVRFAISSTKRSRLLVAYSWLPVAALMMVQVRDSDGTAQQDDVPQPPIDCQSVESESIKSYESNTDGKAVAVPDSMEAAAVKFAQLVGRLKTTPRTGWVRRGVPQCESVADHSWRVAALSLLLLLLPPNAANDSTEDGGSIGARLDVGRCMQLAIVHDLAECIIGDITPEDNISQQEKQEREKTAMIHINNLLQRSIGRDASSSDTSTTTTLLMNLMDEYEERTTNESIAVKDLDLLDMILQAKEYEERYPTIDLSDFFDGTPATRFRTPQIAKLATYIHHQRQLQQQQQEKERRASSQRLQQTMDIVPSSNNATMRPGLSQSDQAFVSQYAKTSVLEADAIIDIVQALRQWDKPP